MPGRVGYFAAENPNDVQARWIGMQEAMEFTSSSVWFCPETIDLAGSYDRISAEADSAGGFDLIIVDTSQAFFSGDDENSNSQMVNHAKAMRKLTTLPGNPCVVILTHPVKNPAKDNLLPRGGGGFLAEVDGNLTLWNDNDSLSLHHQGKFRGAGFAPVNFALRPVNPARLKDAKGRQIPTVIAEHVTEQAALQRRMANASDQDQVMVYLRSRKGKGTYSEIAGFCGWYFKNGNPAKQKVGKIIDKLKSEKYIVEKRAGGFKITSKGFEEFKKAFQQIDNGSADAGDDDED